MVVSETRLADGIRLKTLADSDIRWYQVHTLDSRAIDLWIQHVLDGLEHCAPSQVYRVIYDFSEISLFALNAYWAYTLGSLGMTQKGQARVHQLIEEGRHARLALYTHPTLSARVIRTLNRSELDIPFRMFFVFEQALRWLQQEDTPHG